MATSAFFGENLIFYINTLRCSTYTAKITFLKENSVCVCNVKLVEKKKKLNKYSFFD